VVAPDTTHDLAKVRAMPTKLATLLVSAAASALLLGTAAMPSHSWAACTPGTFAGSIEKCTGTDASIIATLGTNQSVTLQAENVTTGGVQLTAPGATSITLNVPGQASTPPTKRGRTPPPPPPASSIVNSTGSLGGDAIALNSNGGAISLTTGPGVTVKALGTSGQGIYVKTTGSGSIALSTGGNVSAAGDLAVYTVAAGGATTIATAAGTTISGGLEPNSQVVAIMSLSATGAITINDNASTVGAIWATSSNGGALNVGASGNLTFSGNPASAAISASGGNTKVVVAPQVTIASSGAGVYALSEGSSPVEVDTGLGSRILATGNGIQIDSNGGDVTINTAGAIGSAASPVGGQGVLAEIGQGMGNLALNMTAGSIYSAGDGVDVTTQGGGVLTLTTASGTLVSSGAEGLHAFNRSGPTTVNSRAAITAGGGDGMDVAGGGGDISVTTLAGGTVSATGASGDGIYASPTATPGLQTGAVKVVTGANVSSAHGAGIHTVALEGPTTITTAAGTTVSGGGANGAIYATSDNGAITINSNAAAIGGIYGMASNAGAVTINVNGNLTTAGPVAIDANGAGFVHVSVGANAAVQSTGGWGVFGLGAGASGFELDTAVGSKIVSAGANATVEVTTGRFLLNNAGALTTTEGGHQGTALYLLSGAVFSLPATTSIFNNSSTGLLDGQLVVQDGEITLNNAGTWDANGTSAFGASGGLGVVNNTGTIQVGFTTASPAASASAFNGLSAFNIGSSSATGTISMVNGTAGDSLTIGAPFVGAAGHSVLYLDAFLGGPGTIADQLNLTGGSSGQTLIRIHNTSTGSGALNASGIVLVTGATSASNFALDPKGPGYDATHKGVNAGLFLYTLAFNAGDEVLIGSAGVRGTQLPAAVTAGQQVWAATSFTPSVYQGASPATALAEIGFDHPRVWMTAVNGLAADDAVQTGPLMASRQAGGGVATRPGMRLSAIQTSAGFDNGYDQGVATLTGGVDLVRHQGEGSAWSLGVATAYVESDQRFTSGGVSLGYSGVAFGGYAAYRAGGLHIDASVKSDVLKAQYVAQWLGDSRPSAGLATTGVELEAGYRYALASSLALEALASAAIDRTTMSDLQLGSSTVRFAPANSGWANLGVRLSGQARYGSYAIKSAITASAWDAFGTSNTAYISDLGPSSPLNDNLGGLSGELAGELTIAKDQWAEGFVSGSIRQGSAQQTVQAVTGFRLRW
jgi:outer membrane autotransporter protein